MKYVGKKVRFSYFQLGYFEVIKLKRSYKLKFFTNHVY